MLFVGNNSRIPRPIISCPNTRSPIDLPPHPLYKYVMYVGRSVYSFYSDNFFYILNSNSALKTFQLAVVVVAVVIISFDAVIVVVVLLACRWIGVAVSEFKSGNVTQFLMANRRVRISSRLLYSNEMGIECD